MSYHYTGLSAQQVIENRKQFGDNVIQQTTDVSIVDKFQRISTFWLIRVLIVVEIIACIVLLLLDIFLNNLSLSFALILLFLAGIILMVYFVTFMVGHWSESKQHQEVDPLNTTIMIILTIISFITYYQVVFVERNGILPYLGVVVMTITLVAATSITYCMDYKLLHNRLLKGNNRLSKVIREGKTKYIKRKEIVVGDIVLLKKGDEVPADAQLLEAHRLVVDESALMGNTRCRKQPLGIEMKTNDNTLVPPDYVMRGSIVVKGKAIVEVFAVGNKTMASKIETENPQWHVFSEKIIHC